MVIWVFPAVTAGVSAVFGAIMILRYLSRGKPYQLLWALGLFGIMTAAAYQAVEASLGYWPEGIYRVYYWLVGSMVATMGAGTMFLIGRRSLAQYFLYAVIGLVAIQGIVCAVTAINPDGLVPPGMDTGVRAASAPMRILTVILNIAGAGAMLVGALLSWHATKRVHNLVIVAGAVLLSIGGSTAGVDAGGGVAQWALYLGNLSGIVALFAGFLLSRAANDPTAPAAAAAQSAPSA
jgi:hypothetical protein